MEKIKKIFIERGEEIKELKLLSSNDFNRKVYLIKTEQKDYIFKAGRETKREYEILSFLKKQSELDFFPQEFELIRDCLLIEYLPNIKFSSHINDDSNEIEKYFKQLVQIFNYFIDNENYTKFEQVITTPNKGFYDRTIDKYFELITKPIFALNKKESIDIEFEDFMAEFNGICDLDYSFSDLFVVEDEIKFFDFEYFVNGNILVMIFKTFVGLADQLKFKQYKDLGNSFIENLKITQAAKEILKSLLINNFDQTN